MKRILLVIACCTANLLMGAEVSRTVVVDSRQSGEALAEALFKRKDAAKITGDELIAEIKALATERLPYTFWRTVQDRLAGRELTFTNFNIDKDCTFRGNDEGYLLQVDEWKNPFSLMAFFPTSFVDRVSWIQEGDRVARLTGTVLPREDNFAYYALRLRCSDIEMAFPKPPPIEQMFDLKTVTGDELMEKRASIRHSQCHDLARALVGRELTFHNLSFGWLTSAVKEKPCFRFIAKNEARNLDVSFQLSVVFDDPKVQEKVLKLQKFRGTDGFFIRELRGIVASEEENRKGFAGELLLRGTHIEPNEPLEEIPPFDAETITGDGVIQLLKSFKKRYDPHLPKIVDKLIGRTLTFTNVHVSSSCEGSEENPVVKGYMVLTVPRGTNSWATQLLPISARVNAADLDALPWDLSSEDTLLRLSGRVAKKEPERTGCIILVERGIHLEDATFEVAWQNEKLPPFDAKTITGDEFAKVVAGFDDKYRAPKMQRMLKEMNGRRLTFSRCAVREDSVRRRGMDGCQQADFDVVTGLDEQSGKCSIPAVFVGDEQARLLQDLASGTQLTNVSGTVAWVSPWSRQFRNDGWCLTNLSYQVVSPQEDLPDFDAAKITGDELVKLLGGMKRKLTPRQIESLRKKLEGRRLTFTGMKGISCIVGEDSTQQRKSSAYQVKRSVRVVERMGVCREDSKSRIGIKLRTADTEYWDIIKNRPFGKCDDLRVSATVSEKEGKTDSRFRDCVLVLTDGVIERMDGVDAAE